LFCYRLSFLTFKYTIMKRKLILTAIGLFSIIESNAQKHCNLSIAVLTPIEGQVIPLGDTAFVSCRITNWGPDTVAADDTLAIFFNGNFFMTFSREMLPGAIFLEPMLEVWSEGGKNDTLETCLRIEPFVGVSFTDTVPGDDMNCSSFILEGDAPTGIGAVNSMASAMKVYPNPAAADVYIALPEPFTTEPRIAIYDIAGKLVKDKIRIDKTAQQEARIDVSGLRQGIYMLKMQDGNRTAYAKLIVRRP
jgi:hypothetical protein